MPDPQRLYWPDAARGLATFFVVLYHSVTYAAPYGLAADFWPAPIPFLSTVLMPLFFFVSGIFAAKSVRLSWRELLGTRVLTLVWVFLVWVVVRWAWFNLIPGRSVESGIARLFEHMVLPLGGWFIASLAIFYVLAKLTDGLGRWWQLAVASTASMVWFTGAFVLNNRTYDGVMLYFVFFVIAYQWRDIIIAAVRALTFTRGLLIVTVWTVSFFGLEAFGLDGVGPFSFALTVLGTSAGVALAAGMQSQRWLRFIGQMSLPIYVAHSLVIYALVRVLAKTEISDVPGATIWLPVAITVVSIALSIGVALSAARLHGAWLFATPRWLTRTFELVVPAKGTQTPAR